MAHSYVFIMVGKLDNPIYEAEFTDKKEENRHLNQFIIHSALDMVAESMWATNTMFLRTVDKFNDMLISAFVTAGGIRMMMLHDARNEENIRDFFQEVYKLYVRVAMNPFYEPSSQIKSSAFDRKTRALAQKFGLSR